MAMAAPMLLNQEKYGPWAIVAGASEGTGACFAHEIAAAGINLLLIARRAGPLEAIAEDFRRDHGVEVRTLSLYWKPAVEGKRVSVRVNCGGRRIFKHKTY